MYSGGERRERQTKIEESRREGDRSTGEGMSTQAYFAGSTARIETVKLTK